MIHKKLILTFCAAALVAACGQSEQTAEPQQAGTSEEPAVSEAAGNCPQADESGVVEIRQGLTAKIIKPGYGRAAVSKDYADVHTTLGRPVASIHSSSRSMRDRSSRAGTWA